MTLETPQHIYQAGRPIRAVYFPIDSVLSVVRQMRDGSSIEVGTVGRKGYRRSRCCWEPTPPQTKAIVRSQDEPLSSTLSISKRCSAPGRIVFATLWIDFFKPT